MTTRVDITDLTPGLPAAVVVVLFLVGKYWNDLRAGIGRLYSDRQSDAEDKREAGQAIAESRLDFELQERATRTAQQYYERQSAIDVLKDQLAHSRDDISDLQQGQVHIREKLVEIRNLITVQNVTLSKIEENTRK